MREKNCNTIRSTTKSIQQLQKQLQSNLVYGCHRYSPTLLLSPPTPPDSESDKRLAIVQWTPKVKTKNQKINSSTNNNIKKKYKKDFEIEKLLEIK